MRCDYKARFSTRSYAKKVAKIKRKQFGFTRVYHCLDCDYYHMTTSFGDEGHYKGYGVTFK